jgi:pimeloyl-ACP methyl ester carboxylesterase
MTERVIQFGKSVTLRGTVTEAAPSAGAVPVACLLLNAGLVHRVGPNRLHVRLARAFAEAGYTSLRFDLSGRGDSDTRSDGLPYIESSLAEIREAMDYLQASRGATRFVLMGICSGAANAFHAALVDARVAGAVMIDTYAYPTRGYRLRYYGRRLLSASSWWNTLTGRNALGRRLRGRTGADEPQDEDLENPFGNAVVPPREAAAQALRTVLDRGTRLLYLFTGSTGAFNYPGQFRDAFPEVSLGDRVTVLYFPDADHTFTRLHNQQRLVATILRWLTATWPGSPAVVVGEPPAAALAHETRS